MYCIWQSLTRKWGIWILNEYGPSKLTLRMMRYVTLCCRFPHEYDRNIIYVDFFSDMHVVQVDKKIGNDRNNDGYKLKMWWVKLRRQLFQTRCFASVLMGHSYRTKRISIGWCRCQPVQTRPVQTRPAIRARLSFKFCTPTCHRKDSNFRPPACDPA